MHTFFVVFVTDPATTEIYTLSLHDALPISPRLGRPAGKRCEPFLHPRDDGWLPSPSHRRGVRSEEHTSELQSHSDIVCRLLLEKKQQPQSTEHLTQQSAPSIHQQER